MSGFYGYFRPKAAVSQPDLRVNSENERTQRQEKTSASDENLGNSQRWYSRLNPLNLFSYVKQALSHQSLQGSEEEESNSNACSKQIQNATIQIVKNDDTCTTDANGIILFTSKDMVSNKTKDFYRFPFQRKSNKPETGDFKKINKIREGLLKDQIYFSDDCGTKVIHVQVDIGFIPQAVTKALEKTELLTTVEVVFQKTDNIISYSEEICKAVMEFCQKGRCKCERTIIFDVRDEEKFVNLKELVNNYDEDCLAEDIELRSEVQRVEGEHIIKLRCKAFIDRINIQQGKDIQLHDNDVVKWQHICKKDMVNLKQRLEEEKQCVVEQLNISIIEVKAITPVCSKNQMKKWRNEIAGLITTMISDLKVMVYDVDPDILTELVANLVQHDKFKRLPLSVSPNTKHGGLVLCGFENDLTENVDKIIRETVRQAKEKQESCVFSEKMSVASYEIVNNSDSLQNLKTQCSELEVSYSTSREQLEIHGTHKSARKFSETIAKLLNSIHRSELNISPQKKRLLLHRQTQEFIHHQFQINGLNSSIDILKDTNPNSNTERLKVVVLTEPTKQSAGAEAIKIVRASIKNKSFSTRDPEMKQLVEQIQWSDMKKHLKQKYEGKIHIEHDKKIHMVHLICTSDIQSEVMTWFDEQKELKLKKEVLDLELDKFEYLNKWHRTELNTLVKSHGVAISVKQPYVNTGQSKPMFILKGSVEEMKKVISYINDDLFKDIITKPLMLTEFSKLKFLANSDASVFDYLAENKKCFIRIDVAGTESLIKWMSPCERQYFVCKGKAYDADVFVRLKQQNTSQPTKKSEQSSGGKYEELVIPFKKGILEKDFLNTNIVNMLQRVEKRNGKVLAMPMITEPLHDASVEELVQLILEGIQCYINSNENFIVEKFYFHELWQDLVFDTVVKVLSDYFDDKDTSFIDNDADAEDEETMTPRMVFITGKRESVNEINIEREIQDLMRRQNERSLSRTSSTDSVFRNADTGSMESLTLFYLPRPNSEPDLQRNDRTLQSFKSEWEGSMDVQSYTEDRHFSEMPQSSLPQKKWKKSFFGPKKTKKMQHAKSTPNLPPLTEETRGASKGQPLRKSHDDKLFAGSLEIALRDYSGSIGLIEIKLGNNCESTGTCFVVNGGHVMTAYHLFKDILDHCKYMRHQQRRKEWNEKVSVIFGYKNIQEKNALKRYHFNPYPKFTDPNDLDVIILKIETDQGNSALPQPVKLLRSDLPDSVKGITFLGHPRSQPLTVDAQCQIIDPNGNNLKNAKQFVQKNFKQHKDCYNGIEDNRYLMIHSREEPGNSGSPGFLIGHQGLQAPTVCCMFLCIFPEFVFDKTTGEPKINFPPKYMIERAVKMSVIVEAIQTYNPQLCIEIFDDREYSPMEED